MILFFKFIFNRLRLSDPWNYKVPVLMAVVYIFILAHHIPVLVAFKFVLLSLLTIIGIAGYAYLLNDWADETKDLLANKPNSVIGLPIFNRLLLLSVFFVSAVVPWFFFPYSAFNLLLLALELTLFVLYAMPPFRLKETAIGGIICDALYAHTLPSLLAALTFIQIAELAHHNKVHLLAIASALLLFVLTLWQFIVGIRNILLHQILDLNNDIVSGTHTFVTKYSADTTEKWLRYFIIPAELSCFAMFLFFLTSTSYLFIAAYLFFVIYTLFKGQFKLLGYRNFCYKLLDDFYLDYLPIVVLIALCLTDYRFVFFLLLHVLLFRNIVRDLLLSRFTK